MVMIIIIIIILVVIIIIIIVIIFFYFLSKCSRNALDCFYSCVCVCARNNIEETKKIDSVYVYILLFFFFLAFSTIRYDWPGLLICYPRLSLLLFVARFLDRFSIPTPSTSSLCGETQRGTTFVENRDLLYVIHSKG